jgi:hypothetical protein
MALFAQVEIDTVIRLPGHAKDGCFIPELNEFWVRYEYWDSPLVYDSSAFLVLDGATYQLRSRIPVPSRGDADYAWNWRRQKLYVASNSHPESTLVLDAAGDSILRWLTVTPEFHNNRYVSDVDRLYKPARETLFVFDCAADTIVSRVVTPVSGGYGMGYATLDSVGRKLYVGMSNWPVGVPALMGVYDYVADSFTKLIDVSAIDALQPDAMVINHRGRRGCIADHQVEPLRITDVGILDLNSDSLLCTVPAGINNGMLRQVASDERDGKIYIAGCHIDGGHPCTLFVYDCATDSVVSKLEYARTGSGALATCWVPWSNRLYISYTNGWDDTSLVVIDCDTDSIVTRLALGSRWSRSIQLDPVHQRIFVIGADSGTIHVLRDVGYGIAETPTDGQPPQSTLQAWPAQGGYEVEYSVASPCRIDLAVYDLMGREVRKLVAEKQSAGQHSIVWNRTDRGGAAVAPGVYFILLDTPGFRAVKKAVVAR